MKQQPSKTTTAKTLPEAPGKKALTYSPKTVKAGAGAKAAPAVSTAPKAGPAASAGKARAESARTSGHPWLKLSRMLPAILGLFFVSLLVLKLGLSINHFIQSRGEAKLPDFPSEVMALDQKAKGQQNKASSKPASPVAPAHAASDQSAPPAQGTGGQAAQTDAGGASALRDASSIDEMLPYLVRRDAELRRKEEQLRQKEESIKQMEQEVEKKLKDLINVQKEVQAYKTEKADTQTAKIRSLSKIYGSMKPKEAAKLMENMDDQLVVSIISSMNPEEVGNILSVMDVKKAAKISEFLTHR